MAGRVEGVGRGRGPGGRGEEGNSRGPGALGRGAHEEGGVVIGRHVLTATYNLFQTKHMVSMSMQSMTLAISICQSWHCLQLQAC